MPARAGQVPYHLASLSRRRAGQAPQLNSLYNNRTQLGQINHHEVIMLRTLLGITIVAAISSHTLAQEPADAKAVKLKPGDKAPAFEGKTDADKTWKSKDHVGKKILVVYFYPKDMTPGCTKQACNYRDALGDFEENEVEVIGVSGDTVESHQKFKKEHDLNFTLLADPKGKIAKAFGVPARAMAGSLIASRWTFVIDRDGRVAHKDEKVDAANDTATVLKVVEKLQKKS
jgi:peroxiredoxin Q/BCP